MARGVRNHVFFEDFFGREHVVACGAKKATAKGARVAYYSKREELYKIVLASINGTELANNLAALDERCRKRP